MKSALDFKKLSDPEPGDALSSFDCDDINLTLIKKSVHIIFFCSGEIFAMGELCID